MSTSTTSTNKKTSDNDPYHVDFLDISKIPEEIKGKSFCQGKSKLGMTMIPGRKNSKKWDRDLQKDLTRLTKTFGCEVLVTLVETKELVSMSMDQTFFKAITNDFGMESYHCPIHDKYLPPNTTIFCQCVEKVVTRLSEGKVVVLHCAGGKGRAATLCVSTLIAIGIDWRKAIDMCRSARPGTLQNPLQISFVMKFENAWNQYKSKKQVDHIGLPQVLWPF